MAVAAWLWPTTSSRCSPPPPLSSSGFEAEAVHGRRQYPNRAAIVARFRAGETQTLVCTDVMARGFDDPTVTHVIQYEFADNAVDHLHRVGRTARGGAQGAGRVRPGRAPGARARFLSEGPRVCEGV